MNMTINEDTKLDDRIFEALHRLRPGFTSLVSTDGTLGGVAWESAGIDPVRPEELQVEYDALVAAEALASLRSLRDAFLAQSDWTQMPDVTGIDKQAWADYRQALRDLPANTVDPENPVWPEPPQA